MSQRRQYFVGFHNHSGRGLHYLDNALCLPICQIWPKKRFYVARNKGDWGFIFKKKTIFAAAMGSIVPLNIDLAKAFAQPQPFEFKLDNAFFEALDQEEIQGGEIVVSGEARPRHDGMIEAVYHVKGDVQVSCDRCLDLLDFPIEVEDRTLIATEGQDEGTAEPDYVVSPRQREFDLAWAVYQAIELNLPLVRVHPEGQCNPDMLAYIHTETSAEDDEADEDDFE